ncbi:MAG: TldD/PmbA family protein, partial [Eubacteriales bacterium]|nr:TldD/PmbA family protein [Eubacteriales bacterium]
VLDNPLIEKGYGSTSFDSEGVACFNKSVVEKGILKTYLYNLKSAKKDGVKSTGNGFKGGFKGSIGTNVTNFYIENGKTDFNEMIKNVSNGIFIKELSGLHAGVNGISGDFSLLAEGFLIENGKITTPVEQITIAGNYFEMMKNIKDLANDLKFSTSGVGSPSIFVGELDIAGE